MEEGSSDAGQLFRASLNKRDEVVNKNVDIGCALRCRAIKDGVAQWVLALLLVN